MNSRSSRPVIRPICIQAFTSSHVRNIELQRLNTKGTYHRFPHLYSLHPFLVVSLRCGATFSNNACRFARVAVRNLVVTDVKTFKLY